MYIHMKVWDKILLLSKNSFVHFENISLIIIIQIAHTLFTQLLHYHAYYIAVYPIIVLLNSLSLKLLVK